MKYFFMVIFIFLMLIEISFSANASTTVRYPIQNIQGLRSDSDPNKIIIVFSVLYPNGCYTSKFNIDLTNYQEKIIYLVHFARIQDGLCTMALVSKVDHFEIIRPLNGAYDLIDSMTYKKLGTLTVSELNYYLSDINSDSLE